MAVVPKVNNNKSNSSVTFAVQVYLRLFSAQQRSSVLSALKWLFDMFEPILNG